MAIIKNFMNDNSDDGKKKTSSISKFCGICESKFQNGKDDFRLVHCDSCVSTGKNKQADYWRNQFLQKKANTLTPSMEKLLQKLQENKSAKAMLEVPSVQREFQQDSIRSLESIKQDQHKFAISFEEIRNQVMEYIPSVLAELGVNENKVDIEILADMIVPVKINKPIASPLHAKAAIRDIIVPELSKMGALSEGNLKETQIKAHKDSKKHSTEDILSNSVKRVASESSSLSRKIELEDDERTPEDKESPKEVVGEVTREKEEMPKLLNEGIKTHSENEEAPADSEEMPQENTIKRVEQAMAPNVRQITKQAAVKKPEQHLYNSVSKVSKGTPVQAANITPEGRIILSQSRPLSVFVASYSDGGEQSWNYHLTDKGGLFSSSSSAFYAQSPKNFVDFVQSDPTFHKWAFLPEELLEEPEKIEDLSDAPSENEKIEDLSDAISEEDLIEEILQFLPLIEEIHSGDCEENHMNMATVAALDFFERIKSTAMVDLTKLHDEVNAPKTPSENHSDFIKRMERNHPDLLKDYRRQVAKSIGNVPSLEDFVDSKLSKPEEPKNLIHEVAKSVAGLDFDSTASILIEAGYSDDEILEVYAACSDPKFTKHEHDIQKHIQESEEESGKSPEKAEEIGYATINKHKHEAAMTDKQNGNSAANENVSDVAKTFGEADEDAKRGLHNDGTHETDAEIAKDFKRTNDIGAGDDSSA